MAAGIDVSAAPAERVLTMTRTFDAPRELVFKAWTQPEHLKQWFGPRGFTMTFCQMDLRPGGAYRYAMRSPQNTDHRVTGVFSEIDEPRRLVYTYNWADAEWNPTRPETVVMLSFEDQDGKTRLTLHQSVFESVTACDAHRQGWTTALECLAEYLLKA